MDESRGKKRTTTDSSSRQESFLKNDDQLLQDTVGKIDSLGLTDLVANPTRTLKRLNDKYKTAHEAAEKERDQIEKLRNEIFREKVLRLLDFDDDKYDEEEEEEKDKGESSFDCLKKFEELRRKTYHLRDELKRETKPEIEEVIKKVKKARQAPKEQVDEIIKHLKQTFSKRWKRLLSDELEAFKKRDDYDDGDENEKGSHANPLVADLTVIDALKKCVSELEQLYVAFSKKIAKIANETGLKTDSALEEVDRLLKIYRERGEEMFEKVIAVLVEQHLQETEQRTNKRKAAEMDDTFDSDCDEVLHQILEKMNSLEDKAKGWIRKAKDEMKRAVSRYRYQEKWEACVKKIALIRMRSNPSFVERLTTLSSQDTDDDDTDDDEDSE